VASGARPGIVLGPLDQPGLNGIVLEEANFFEDARVVKRAGHEAGTPELAAQALFLVKELGVLHMKGVERPGETIARPGDAYIVDVIRHQAIRPDVEAVALGAFPEPAEVAAVVRVFLEDDLFAVPPLADRMRVAEQDGAG